MKLFGIALWLLVQVACVSTGVVLGDAKSDVSKTRGPDYVDYLDYYVLGFVGQNTVDLARVCGDLKPRAVQQVRTIEDGVITFATLGIYSPITVRAWCGE